MKIKLTKADIGKRFICRNGQVVTIKADPDPYGWHKFMDVENGFYRGVDGSLFSPDSGHAQPSEWDLLYGPIQTKVRAPKRNNTQASTKRGKTSMRTTPNKYFIGKMEKVKRGSLFRIFRRRRNAIGLVVDEICTRNGWKRIKTGYKKVGVFLHSQASIRADKRWYELNA